jgi:hypothetical protein
MQCFVFARGFIKQRGPTSNTIHSKHKREQKNLQKFSQLNKEKYTQEKTTSNNRI